MTATTLTSTTTPARVAQLRTVVAGPVLLPGDDEYAAETAAWNLSVTHSPDLVVAATCAADVVAAVRFAAEHGMSVAVQATGHGADSPHTGCLLVTTHRMQGLSVDPVERVARVEAGVKWIRVLQAAEPYGLAPVNGSSSDVGVVGYLTGGGLGVLSRRYGLGVDLVRSLDVVTADGGLRHVTPASDPDLFWAIRGGKSSFGVVTAVEVELVCLPDLVGGGLFFDGADAAAVLHAWREWTATLSDRTSTSIAFLRLPDAPFVPEPLRGGLRVHVRFAHLGPLDQAAELLAPIRAVATPLVDNVGPIRPSQMDAVHLDPEHPTPAGYQRGTVLTELSAATADALLRVAGNDVQLPVVLLEVRLLGGAIARKPERPSAAPGRDGAFSVFMLGAPLPDQAIARAAVNGVLAALAPWDSGRCFINLIGNVDECQMQKAWRPDDLVRLRAIKAAYDPHDLFRHGTTVRPS